MNLLANLKGTTGPIYSQDWSPDGRMLASAGYAQIKLWDATLYREIAALRGHTSFIWGLAWSPDGSCLASAGQDGCVKLWNAANWQEPVHLANGEWAFCVAWSPDGKRLVVGTGAFRDESNPETFSGKSQIWDIETHQLLREIDVSSLIISTAWSPNGRTIAVGQWDGRLTFWDGETATPLKSLMATPERCDVNGLAWSPDGRMLATAQQDGKLRIWEPETGEILKIFEGHKSPLRGITWSPDGKILASASTGQDAEIRLWQVDNGQMLACLTPESLPIWSLQWSPDGNWLSAGDGLFGDENVRSQVLIFKMPFGEIS